MSKRPFSKKTSLGTDLKSAFEFFVSPEPNSGCWLWDGPYFAQRNGYGCFTMRSAGIVQSRAHRVSWLIYKGKLHPTDHVLNKCDTPACVNPDHLFIGDQSDNMTDKVRKGRQNRGNSHGMAKIDEATAIAIIRDLRLQKDIADHYGVSVVTVSDIKRGRSWKHLDAYRRAA